MAVMVGTGEPLLVGASDGGDSDGGLVVGAAVVGFVVVGDSDG